jgi:hypothetical protein
MQQVKELLRFLGRDDELYFDRESPGELEEPRLVEDVVSTEARHGFERRAATDAELIALLEQPLPREVAAMSMTLVHIKAK